MTYPILQFFESGHLPPHLREVSERFAVLAHHLAGTLPFNLETHQALRKLLEAKDCSVRAVLYRGGDRS